VGFSFLQKINLGQGPGLALLEAHIIAQARWHEQEAYVEKQKRERQAAASTVEK